MSNREIQDLVDSYLLNQISAENKARLLDMMEADPVFAQHVKECEETYKVLQAARNRELRKKLRAWDAGIKLPGRRMGRGVLIFFLFTILLLGSWCWLCYHFSPVTMATHGFNAIPENAIKADENRKYPVGWQKGIEAFRQEDFEKANLVFMSATLSDDQVLSGIARWNILLCQLAMSGPSGEWMEELNALSKSAPDPIHYEARKLLRMIHSPWYKHLYQGNLHKTFKSVQPRII